jgi:replication factor C large subunit
VGYHDLDLDILSRSESWWSDLSGQMLNGSGMDWAEKYRPKHLADLVGNKESVRQMIQWAQTWTGQSEPLLIYGKPGTGKTSAAVALALDMNWEIVELNASDQRTKAVIERVAGTSSSTGSLTGNGRKLIVLDEADNLQGNSDRGGARAIVEVIRNSSQPIIIIANDLYGLDPAIRNLCEKVLFRAAQARTIAPRLKEICINEGISCDISALNDISERAGGDIRSAVTMLYAVTIGKTELFGEDLFTSKKDSRSTIFDLVSATISPKSTRSLLDLSFEVDETPDTILQWIEGNIGLLKDPSAISGAYQAVSRSDEYLGRTFRAQYYTLWRYATAIMLLGVRSNAKGSGGFMKIMPPERWKRMSSGKRIKTAREQLLSRLGSSMHMASCTIRNGYIMPVSLMAQQDPMKYAETFSLDTDQLDLLIQDTVVAKSIIKQIEDARKLAERELKKRLKEEAGSAKRTKKTARTTVEKEVAITGNNGEFAWDSVKSAPVSPLPNKSESPDLPGFAGSEPVSTAANDPETPGKKNAKKGEKPAAQATLFSFGE